MLSTTPPGQHLTIKICLFGCNGYNSLSDTQTRLSHEHRQRLRVNELPVLKEPMNIWQPKTMLRD